MIDKQCPTHGLPPIKHVALREFFLLQICNSDNGKRRVMHAPFFIQISLAPRHESRKDMDARSPRVIGLLWTWALMSPSKVRISLTANVSAESASALATSSTTQTRLDRSAMDAPKETP